MSDLVASSMPFKRGWAVVPLAVAAIAAGVAFLGAGKAPAGTGHRSIGPAAVPVSVASVVREDVPVRLRALGSVVAFNTVTVRPRVDGQLMRVLFREGQFVRRGDLLAEIDPRPFQVQLEQGEGQLARDQAQLVNARVELARYQTLLGDDSIARQNVDVQASTVAQLQAALKVDEAAIHNARLNLSYALVTRPSAVASASVSSTPGMSSPPPARPGSWSSPSSNPYRSCSRCPRISFVSCCRA